MKTHLNRAWLLAALAALSAHVATTAQSQQPTVQIPQPGVPQIMTMEAKFVRAAYNNEGYVILGYQAANRSIGEEWMLLEVGMTLREKVPAYTLKREALTLDTADGTTIPLPSTEEFRAAPTQGLQNRARVQRDSINYFPPTASRACRLGFFSDLSDPVMAWDQVELDQTRACVGRLYFKIPGGIKYGQYWLNVKLEKSVLRVPLRILTADEEKFLSKNYKAIDKQVKEAFRKK